MGIGVGGCAVSVQSSFRDSVVKSLLIVVGVKDDVVNERVNAGVVGENLGVVDDRVGVVVVVFVVTAGESGYFKDVL